MLTNFLLFVFRGEFAEYGALVQRMVLGADDTLPGIGLECSVAGNRPLRGLLYVVDWCNFD